MPVRRERPNQPRLKYSTDSKERKIMITPGSGNKAPSESDIAREIRVYKASEKITDDDPLSIENCFRWREYGKRDVPNRCDNDYDRTKT